MEEKIEVWIKKHQEMIGLENVEVIDRKSGESNHNIILEAESGKYVCRVSKNVSRRDRLENESRALKILQKYGIGKVPRLEVFEKDTEVGSVLVENFIEGEDIRFARSLDKTQIRRLARTVAEIHSIPVKEVEKDGYEEFRDLREIYREEFDRWSERPYRKYLGLVEEPDERIEKFYGKQKELIQKVPGLEVEQSFIHSDLGFNLLSNDGEVFILDWEYGTAGYPGHDIMILFEHGRLTDKQREIFLDSYTELRDLGEVFEKVREIHPKFLAFHDAVWAARRNEKGEDREKLLEEKIGKLEKLYSQNG